MSSVIPRERKYFYPTSMFEVVGEAENPEDIVG